MAGLFDTFTIAKRGLNVQQTNIDVTSHNISNASTTGYSRQRAVVETTRPFGGMSRFDTCSVGQIGTGSQITAIQRIRDSFIDYQVRSETGTAGYYTTTSDALTKVEGVFSEPSDTGIQELMNNFFSAFQEVSKNPDKSDVKTVAIQKASSLADAINYAYNQLQTNIDDSQKTLLTNVTDVNSYLDQINELNKQIRSVSAVGETPNDLMDKRDNLIDQLSNDFGIKIDKDKFDSINLSSIEYPNSVFVKANPSDVDYSRLSYVESAVAEEAPKANPTDPTTYTGKVTVTYYPLGNKDLPLQTLTINDGGKALADELNQCRILISDKDGIVGATDTSTTPPTTTPPTTEADLKKYIFKTYEYESGVNNVDNNHIKGQIAGNQGVQVTIKSYMDNLDKLAAGLAYSVNAIATASLDSASAGQGLNNNPIFVTYDSTTQTYSTNDTGITAKSIKVSDVLVKDPTKLNCAATSTSGDGDGSRANAIANLNIVKMDFSSITASDDLTAMDRQDFLTKLGITGFSDTTDLALTAGTNGFTSDSYYKSIINKCAVDTQEAGRISSNQDVILSNLDSQRQAVSGVSIDEETTNLIQYQHAYQANAKVISTIDELLDVVINGLKK